MAATVPFRVTDLIKKYGWDAMVRLSALGVQNLAEAQVLFVDSGETNALDADDGYHGHSLETPLATIDYAVGLCTASEQSIILVAPGHAETEAAAAALVTCDIAGVKIIGMGEGTLRPTITLSTDTGAIAFSITAANVVISNIRIVPAVDAVAKCISVAASDCKLIDIEVADTSASVEAAIGILTTAAADRLYIENYKHNGFLAGNACTQAISLVGVDRAEIVDCWFRGAFSTAAIQMVSTACSGVVIRGCVFENGTTALSLDIIDNASSKWSAIGCFDVVGGYGFSGGSGAALASDDVSAVSAAIAVVDGNTDKIDSATLDTTPVAASLATFVAGGAGGIGTQLPTTTSLYDTTKAVSTVGVTGAPVASTLADTLHKDGSFTYDNTTDSLEALSDKTGGFSGDGGAAQDDSVKASLDLAHTDLDAIIASIAAGVPQLATKAIADMTGFDTAAVFTVTGDVMVQVFGVVGATPITSTSGTTVLSLGTTQAAQGIIANSTVDNTQFDATDVWVDSSPSVDVEAIAAQDWHVIGGGADIVLARDVDDITAGALTLYCRWVPISSGATVVPVA